MEKKKYSVLALFAGIMFIAICALNIGEQIINPTRTVLAYALILNGATVEQLLSYTISLNIGLFIIGLALIIQKPVLAIIGSILSVLDAISEIMLLLNSGRIVHRIAFDFYWHVGIALAFIFLFILSIIWAKKGHKAAKGMWFIPLLLMIITVVLLIVGKFEAEMYKLDIIAFLLYFPAFLFAGLGALVLSKKRVVEINGNQAAYGNNVAYGNNTAYGNNAAYGNSPAGNGYQNAQQYSNGDAHRDESAIEAYRKMYEDGFITKEEYEAKVKEIRFGR